MREVLHFSLSRNYLVIIKFPNRMGELEGGNSSSDEIECLAKSAKGYSWRLNRSGMRLRSFR